MLSSIALFAQPQAPQGGFPQGGFPGGFPQGAPNAQRPQNAPRQWGQDVDRTKNNLTLDMYFEPQTAEAAAPDAEGFIRRWSLLDPINKPNRSNTVFTDSYIRAAFDTLYFKDQKAIVPKDGQKVKVGKEKLAWHCYDSKLYNVKLFRFASETDKQVYGVLFWAVTVINCDEDMTVRLSVGSNSASQWWLNGEDVLILSGDRRMVADDAMSKRITLHKGQNVLRGAVINGPGMSDFCVRFVDESGKPVTNYTITNKIVK